jgi:peptide subunit release factor RF-3
MTTVKLSGKEYKLGQFALPHILPLARFINDLNKEKAVSLELWEEVAEIIKENLVPEIEESLVNPTVKRGIFLKSDDLQSLYTTVIKKLKSDGEFIDLDIETGEGIEQSKEDKIKALEEELSSLKA